MSGHIEVNNIELSLGLVGPQGIPGPTGPAGSAGNVDGGRADSNYTGTQLINGGTAGSF